MPADPPTPTGVASPCTSVCRLDPATGWCEGCYRTIEEIAAWGVLDDAGKLAVLRALPGRRGKAEGRSRGKR